MIYLIREGICCQQNRINKPTKWSTKSLTALGRGRICLSSNLNLHITIRLLLLKFSIQGLADIMKKWQKVNWTKSNEVFLFTIWTTLILRIVFQRVQNVSFTVKSLNWKVRLTKISQTIQIVSRSLLCTILSFCAKSWSSTSLYPRN